MSSPKKRGTKKEVYYGKALRTSGGLTKDDLIVNSRGKVVSKKQSQAGKKRFEENKESMKPFQARANPSPASPPPKPIQRSSPEPAKPPPAPKKKRSKKR